MTNERVSPSPLAGEGAERKKREAEVSLDWQRNLEIPLNRRLAYARRHPLPQGERGREGPHNEATADVTLSRRGRGQERGDRAVSRPETPFPRHWRYYIVLKWTVITAAVVIALKLFEAW
jgi:hypothetical protein